MRRVQCGWASRERNAVEVSWAETVVGETRKTRKQVIQSESRGEEGMKKRGEGDSVGCFSLQHMDRRR